MNTNSVKSDTIARTIILALALVNQALAIAGKDKIPVVESDIYQVCSLLVTIISSVWSWWKNASFTKGAIAADQVMEKIKQGELSVEDVNSLTDNKE